ncbi:MAG: double-strand break repair helicase AddA [Variibacter sp.]
MKPIDIPENVLGAQIAASDPRVSAWVTANAGSGKTYVLAQRVIRLLLDGVPPGKILCLTFTKAAAANMANRVFETLAAWTTLGDEELAAAVMRIETRRPDATRLRRARCLFAEALETPGGLKVQTIHAFCTGLLHQFPFEADVAARFEVLEEHAESELIDSLRLAVLLEAAAQPESALGRALAIAVAAAADVTFADVVRNAIDQRDAVDGWIARAGGVDAAIAELSCALGADPAETLDDVHAQFLDSPILPRSEWPSIAAVLAGGSKTDRARADGFARAIAGSAWENIEAYIGIFFTKGGTPAKSLATKAIKDQHPELCERLLRERERVAALWELRKAVIVRDRTMALVTIAHEVTRRYRAEKDRRGLLDYDDLVDKTLALLDNVAAAWVHYKLDLGIDHILVDEAQDTSPKQWDVIARLTSEFFAGAGARGATRRSIFAVGDEKQSIWSVQGAAPLRFDEMRRQVERALRASDLPFEPLPFLHSFRSGPNVLGAVDAVFAQERAYRGLATDPVPTVHQALRHNAPGLVEVWPLIAPEKREEMEAWDAPFDAVAETSPQARLARRIAESVRFWIDRRVPLPLTGQRTRPGDILVLVRSRGPLFAAVIRALKDAGVDVAGADRLVLTEHIAVMDLMSLADALLLEEDDLALAEVLKSPLFGLNDEQLFALAWQRTGSLRAALRANAAGDAACARAAATLDRLAAGARTQAPFTFYAALLNAEGGRRKFLARLGPEANDALDEFLALALDYERRETPSLQGFMAWLRAVAAEVKRDMDIARDEVRVMTVHGAKGLEAPIVILADTTSAPAGPRDPPLLAIDLPGLPTGAARPLVWVGGQANDVPVTEDARKKARRDAEEEHRRLLYVAMTRAADRLIVCGARGQNAQPDGCWYDLVHAALTPDAADVPADIGGGNVWRWQKFPGEDLVVTEDRGQTSDAPDVVPPWLGAAASRDIDALPRIAPSLAAEDAPAARARLALSPDLRGARQRGQWMHRLMQSLPDVPRAARADAARRFLTRAGIDADAIDAILAPVMRVLDDAQFAAFFDAGTRAEVPIVGRLMRADGAPQFVSARIDRLAVDSENVFIVDYKSDRMPPDDPDRAPGSYVTQLALYRAVLRQIYPGRAIRAALLWTERPLLMELPAAALDAALARLGIAAPA